MKLTEGTTVCISLQALYDNFSSLKFGKIEPDFGKTDLDSNYYDLYNKDGEIACMNGEEVTIELLGDQLITFRNDNGERSVYFELTYEEAAVAIVR